MSKRVGWMLIGLVVGWAGSAQGQPAFQVRGGGQRAAVFLSASSTGGPSGLGEVLRAQVTHSQTQNSLAVVGVSEPQPGWGYGGWFHGGFIGVRATSGGVASPDVHFGVSGKASLGSSNYGVHGNASGDESGTLAYGVYGTASCDSPFACTKYAVYSDGDLLVTGNTLAPSDLRFKESLAPLDHALGKLLALEVVSYEHVRTEEVAHMHLPEGPQVGFIAQQLAEVLPDLVAEAVHPAAGDPRERGPETEPIRYQALKTIDLIPYLVRAVQEQQAEIEELRAQLLPLRNRLAELGPEPGEGEARVPAAL